MTTALDILVVDDAGVNRRLMCLFAASLGHRTSTARDGAEAVAACQQKLPDLILMDIMMPVMDGIQAAAEIRRLCGAHWLPIIFLSARKAEADQIEVLGIGDDFLPKPVNLRMLEARINVMVRIAEMQRNLAETASRLEDYRQASEREQEFARDLYEQVISYRNCDSGKLKRWIKPAQHLSGDVIAHVYADNGTLNFLIADSTGHGLAAAICALPAVDTFIAMARKNLPIDTIAREINAKLHRLLPTGRFVCAALVRVEFEQRLVQVWNGGIPLLAFVSTQGQIMRQWTSQQPPLGALGDEDFDAATETWQWSEAGQILLCSDGLTEAEDRRGELFGSEGFLSALRTARGNNAFETVIGAVQRHMDGRDNRDDLSLAAIDCQC